MSLNILPRARPRSPILRTSPPFRHFHLEPQAPLPLHPGSLHSERPNPFPGPVHSAPAPSPSSQAQGSSRTNSSRSMAVPEAWLFPLLLPSRSSLTKSPLHPAGPTQRPRPHLPSNCWFPPPSLLPNVSRDRQVEALSARESPPRLLPPRAPRLMGYGSLRRHCHLVDHSLFYSFK